MWLPVYGSSPQVRGKQSHPPWCRRTYWLIPAGAGKTWTVKPGLHKIQAHPRRCGENLDFIAFADLIDGSSPQVRGKLVISSPFSMRVRLIPAGAGKTFLRVRILLASSAHPRRCGENAGGVFLCHFLSGSSPQVRGKPQRCNEPLVTRRLIPAGAGKTHVAGKEVTQVSAHPRRCGENRSVAYR